MSNHNGTRRVTAERIIYALQGYIDARLDYTRKPCVNYANAINDKADALADALVNMLDETNVEIRDDVVTGFVNALGDMSNNPSI